jgi:DNA polymerase-3 subunit gamma/tau
VTKPTPTEQILPLVHPKPAEHPTVKDVVATKPPTHEAADFIDTAWGKEWFELVQELAASQKIQAMTRELAMQAQLTDRQEGQWELQVERETLLSASNIERLQTALQAAGHEVILKCKIGSATDTPSIRLARHQKQVLAQFEQDILSDPVVQQLITEFDAKIVPGSLKPRIQ